MKKRKMLRTTTLFISVLVIATLAIGAYLVIYRNISTYDKQLQIMQKDLLINFQTKVDETLNAATREITAWMLEDRVIQFATEETHSHYNTVKIYEKLTERTFLFQELDCVYGIFRPDLDMFITNMGVIHYEHLEGKYDFVPDSMAYIGGLADKEFVNNFYLAEDLSVNGERLNLFLRRSSGDEVDAEIYGIISLNLKQLTKQLSQLDNGAFFALKDGRSFFSSRPDANLQALQQLEEPSDLIYNLRYAIGTEKRSNTIWLVYGLLLLLFMAAGVCGSFFLARFLHRPVENILRQVSADDEADIYDEEAYIRSRFVEIKTVNQQLAGQISEQEQYLKQNFVRDLLYGMVSDDVLREKAVEYGLCNLHGNVVMAVLEENKSETRGTMLSNRITALLATKIENSIVVFLNAEQIAVIAQGIDSGSFQKAVIQAILQISEWYDVSYTGAVCEGEIASPVELSRIFSEAVRYLQNGDFSYDKLIITKEDLREREEYSYYYPLEFEKNIISCIADNEFDRAMQMVQTILNKNLVDMKLSKAALTELKFAIVGTIKRILQVLKKTEAELFGEGSILYLELSACKTPEEISGKVYEMFSAIRSFAEDVYDSSNYALIDQIEAYIQGNYQHEDMSLLLLAERFNLTTGYISRIFKKCREVNFKDYLAAYRIQKATEILELSPDIRIADLARQVGYDNVQRFVRNFKKLKQVPPGEYKKQQ